jgi:hypothetical protein
MPPLRPGSRQPPSNDLCRGIDAQEGVVARGRFDEVQIDWHAATFLETKRKGWKKAAGNITFARARRGHVGIRRAT